MKPLFISISLMMGFFHFTALAEGTKKTAPKSQFNTQVYEQEQSSKSFSAVVKVLREVQGETQVFFEGQQGFFSLGNDSLQEKLVKSQKEKKAVSVEVDMAARRILKVEWN